MSLKKQHNQNAELKTENQLFHDDKTQNSKQPFRARAL
jgi:hypothetical protein